jgi:hypothetical protein
MERWFIVYPAHVTALHHSTLRGGARLVQQLPS